MRVTGESFRYDPARRLLASAGPVDATRGGLVASAKAGSVDTRDGVLVLDGDARLRGRGDEGRPVELRAPRVLVGRDGRLEASGGAVLKTDRFLLRGGTLRPGKHARRQSPPRDDGRAPLRAAGSRPAPRRPGGRRRRARSRARHPGPARRLRGERARARPGWTSRRPRRRARAAPSLPASAGSKTGASPS